MKIEIQKIPIEGFRMEEVVPAAKLDVEIDAVTFKKPILARAYVTKITNAITVELELDTALSMRCSRCLGEFPVDFKKEIRLNYTVDKLESVIDLDPEIREEFILDYPIKPLCSPQCKGLCVQCGGNLNEGGCSCGST